MEEIIELLSAYFTALVEKGYMNQTGRGTARFREETSCELFYFLAKPNYDAVTSIETDPESITRIVHDGYHFWLDLSDRTGTWDWVTYSDGKWKSFSILLNNMPEIIRRTANRIGLELKIKQPSEISIAARLLDDEMQYEI